MKDYSDVQNLEINSCDIGSLLNILMDAGYQCVCEKDGISNEVTLVQVIHPEYTGRKFVVSER